MKRNPLFSTLALGAGILAFTSHGCTDDASTETDTSIPSDTGDAAPVELTPALCDDPSNLQAVLDSLGSSGSSEGGGLGMNEDQLQALLSNPTETFYMVNLIKYREVAEYADGRETDLTGREANALYDPMPFITAMGGRVVYNSAVDQQIAGAEDVAWDDVAIVEYPCPIGFLAMVTHPDFQATSIHKDAGVETTRVMFTELQPLPAPADPDQSEAAFPPTDEDPAFDLMHVMDFHDIAQYEPDADEPERTGREAWDLYQSSGTGVSVELGHYPTAFFRVRGTLIGENTGWDEIQIIHMSSQAGFQALLDDTTRQENRYHRYAALADNDSMEMFPTISTIPYADGDPGGGSSPVVTEDGVGTICTSDADCPGGGVDTCLTDGGAAGFCTREGCGAGECQSPYLCCHDCAPVAAAMLPFDGSACLPGDTIGQLTLAPVSCTCD
jgi:hypothetical protein